LYKEKVKHAVIWSALDILFRQIIAFVVSVILARLLTPEDYGTIALLTLFTGIAVLFVDSGFSAALIQRDNITNVDESTVFWFNITMAFFMMLLLIVISPFLSNFFEVQVLIPLSILMGCNIFLGSLGGIHRTLLSKKLDFKTQTIITSLSISISGVVAVYMASANYGVWSLAAYIVINTLVATILLWVLYPWRPTIVFSISSFKSLYGYSFYIFADSFLQVMYQKGYTVLIGKIFGVSPLGHYQRAESTKVLISEQLTRIVSRVTFPVYSNINQKPEKLLKVFRLSIRSLMLISAPSLIGLSVISDQFIPIIFGEQWTPAVPILQVICFAGIFLPINSANVNLLKAQGRADLVFRIGIIKKVIGIVILVTGSFWGVMGVAWATVLHSIYSLLINAHYTEKNLNYSLFKQLSDCFPSLILSVVMSSLIIIVKLFFDLEGVVGLLISIMIGVLSYLLLNIILRVSAFTETVEILTRKK